MPPKADVETTQTSIAPRLWPGVAIVAALWVTRLGASFVGAGAATEFIVRVFGGVIGTFAVLVWWLVFSRVPWSQRAGALVRMIAAPAAAWMLGDPSILVWVVWYAGPILSLALVAAAVAGRGMTSRSQHLMMAAAIVLPCAATMMVRVAGVQGHGVADFKWRWTTTAEQRLLGLLARASDEPLVARNASPLPATATAVTPGTSATPAAPATPAAAAIPAIRWAGFRGPDRNGSVPGVLIETDWSSAPPTELWRRPVGPGWSSFAVRGDILYTQEQRGGDELVSAYRVSTGEPVWQHRDPARFDDPMGGPGPRSTPTLAFNRVYAFGPTGILKALDAATGAVAWSRNAGSDAKAAVPVWGFASSPLIVDDLVIVGIGGTLAGYAAATGELRWLGAAGIDSYSSPHLAIIDGVTQIMLADAIRVTGVVPATGEPLWTYAWDSRVPILPIVQPVQLDDGHLVMGDLFGMHRLAVVHGESGWTVTEKWVSNGLKPYFNDFVVHRGHAYGFDGAILASLDLADGHRTWKGGRYGQGQLVLLPDQDLLLVLSEEGEIALVKATPERFTEIARFRALTGKTWNHPVIVGDVLLVRNGEEMAAFRLRPARPPFARP